MTDWWERIADRLGALGRPSAVVAVSCIAAVVVIAVLISRGDSTEGGPLTAPPGDPSGSEVAATDGQGTAKRAAAPATKSSWNAGDKAGSSVDQADPRARDDAGSGSMAPSGGGTGGAEPGASTPADPPADDPSGGGTEDAEPAPPVPAPSTPSGGPTSSGPTGDDSKAASAANEENVEPSGSPEPGPGEKEPKGSPAPEPGPGEAGGGS